nr:ISL3 family transposase [Beijerinckia indica]
MVSALASGTRSCPGCGVVSTRRHSWHVRHLQDLPIQGIPVTIALQLGRWRCRNESCSRKTFVEKISTAFPFARRTARVGEIIRLFGHAAGGRVGARLLDRLAMPTSHNTVLRHLKRHASASKLKAPLRIAAIDDWSWRRGETYGTIIVDLERRTVVDVLPVRSVESTEHWLRQHPGIEIVSRDRCGLYAQAIRQGAPQAQQVTDRFHLLQNLREAIERQMERVSRFAGRSLLPAGSDAKREAPRQASREARLALFQNVHELHSAGMPITAIKDKTGLALHTLRQWVRLDDLPARRHPAPTARSPASFKDFLKQQWEAGNRCGRHLLHDLRHRGYTGSRSHLYHFIAEWRRLEPDESRNIKASPTPHTPLAETKAIDPVTGWQISPKVAAVLCLKPTRLLTPRQALKVKALKQASPSFVTMRALAMRFRGLMRSKEPSKLEKWLEKVRHAAILPLQQFAKTLRRDLAAVRNAITQPWSSGQAEGQINRLKTLKRTMYGRAGNELLRARMMPFDFVNETVNGMPDP